MHFPLHGKKKALPLHSQLSNCPDGGIGRRAGLKHQWGNPSRFDPGSGYEEILVEHIYGGFSFIKTSKLVTFGRINAKCDHFFVYLKEMIRPYIYSTNLTARSEFSDSIAANFAYSLRF